jgi:DNA invertase Pin-like site-specific DNA recombinase
VVHDFVEHIDDVAIEVIAFLPCDTFVQKYEGATMKIVGYARVSTRDQDLTGTTPTGRLLSTLLAAIAEFERELIRERTGEGRKRAKAGGVRFGRPSVLTPHQRTEVLARLAEGDSYADIARSYNVDRSTISRLKPKPEAAAA